MVALNKMPDCYAMYYDHVAQYGQGNRNLKTHDYHGIVGADSNDVRLSSVPKGEIPVAIMLFNKNAYSVHCKDYREYQDWMSKRNTLRYVTNKEHGQQYDSKNLLHCRRLLDMAIEIAQTGTFAVLRPNTEYLLQIRRGEVPLHEIIEQAEIDVKRLDELFAASSLPNTVDREFLHELLLEVRYHD